MQQEQLFEQIFNSDDISWQSMIFEAVRSEQMDPWDINLHALSDRFMGMLRSLKDMNLRVPGKVVLASAILLKLKSHRFLYDINNLDKLIAYTEAPEQEQWDDDDIEYDDESQAEQTPELVPRTPQPRTRKVSVYDLVKALEKALEVKNRRKVLTQRAEPKFSLPNQIFDLSMTMDTVYKSVCDYYQDNAELLMFSQVIPSGSKEDKVFTFIPLLHLCNQQKVDLHQSAHFADFAIELLNKNPKPQETL